jgi:hypothetical protein
MLARYDRGVARKHHAAAKQKGASQIFKLPAIRKDRSQVPRPPENCGA